MNEYMFNKITQSSYDTQNKKLRLFAKVNLSSKLEIIKEQKPLFHKLKNTYEDVDNSTLTYASLILAIDKFEKQKNSVNLKAIKLRSKKQRANIKREKLLSYWSIVKTLKYDEELSFRDISDYLKKYHKFEVSYSFIYQIWNEVENTNINKEK